MTFFSSTHILLSFIIQNGNVWEKSHVVECHQAKNLSVPSVVAYIQQRSEASASPKLNILAHLVTVAVCCIVLDCYGNPQTWRKSSVNELPIKWFSH